MTSHILTRSILAFFALQAVQTLCASPSRAAPTRTASSEYELLRRFPAGWLAALSDADRPDANGFTGGNRSLGRWIGAGMQRGGCRYLIAGVANGDLARVEDGWRAIETAFAHQQADGGFDSTPAADINPADPHTARVQTAFFFLQELGRAILILRQSPFEPQFRTRIDGLKPRLRLSCDFIAGGYDTIIANSSKAVNRLFLAAKAFGLCGLVLEDETLVATARRLVARGLEMRDAAGVFLEHGGRDSSYNAVTIFAGETVLQYLSLPEFEAALPAAVTWELTQIKGSGEAKTDDNTRTGIGAETYLGEPKTVNYVVVIMALEVYGLRCGDERALAAANHVYDWWSRRKRVEN